MPGPPAWIIPGQAPTPLAYGYPHPSPMQGYYVNQLGYRNPWAGQPVVPGSRPPYPYPSVDSDLPAANLSNSTGGVGCEPGYNYFFPSEHCKMHVFKTGSTAPWQLPPNFSVNFAPIHVPVGTTIGDLLKGFGATNPVGKKNKITEVVQGGGGRWYKGMSFNGDNEKALDKAIKDVGWDATRTGFVGQKPVVYVYVERG